MPNHFHIFGYDFFVENSPWLAIHLYRNGVFEKSITNFVKSNVLAGQRVIDIGANIGYYTLLFSSLVGNSGTVFSFEPAPDNYKLLQQNITANKIKNTKSRNVAISDFNGKTKLYLSASNSGCHKITFMPNSKSVDIDVITLNYDDISLIKIDVEGAELDVLHGIESIINKCHPILIMEFEPQLLQQHGVKPSQVLSFIKDHDYHISIFDRNEENENQLLESGCNLLCVKNDP